MGVVGLALGAVVLPLLLRVEGGGSPSDSNANAVPPAAAQVSRSPDGADVAEVPRAQAAAVEPVGRGREAEYARAEVARRNSSFEREARDDGWAAPAERSLSSSVSQAVVNRGATVDLVECGTRTCRVTMTWDSYETAFARYRHILVYPYALSCRRFMAIPPPADGRDEYQSQLFFDCDR